MGVKVRQKPPSKKDGRSRLYLDFAHERKRWYETLNLYLFPDTTGNKARNERTLAEAEKYAGEQWFRVVTGEYHQNTPDVTTNIRRQPFLDFFKSLSEEKGSGSNREQWEAVARKIQGFPKVSAALVDCDAAWLAAMRSFFNQLPLSQNTRSTYFSRVREALKIAAERGYISIDPRIRVKAIKAGDPKVVHLSEGELVRLAATPFPQSRQYPDIPFAFLLAAYLGMRVSDTRALKWSDIKSYDDETYMISFTNEKKKRVEHEFVRKSVLDPLIGPRKDRQGRVFKLGTSKTVNDSLRSWAGAAGIETEITFHVSKRTCAMRLMSKGVPDAVIASAIRHMGERSLKHYRRVLDPQRIEAVAMLPTGPIDSLANRRS